MKSTIFVLICSFIGLQSTFAQNKAQQYAKAEKVWLGIDFSKTTFVDQLAFTNADALPGLMLAWNTFVEREADKYNMKKAFDDKTSIDLSQTNARYETIDTKEIVKNSCGELSQEEAIEIALTYDFTNVNGLAAMMVAECFSKNAEAGTFWLIVVNAEDKSIFYAKKYTGKPGGFGVKNYWAKSFHNVLREIEKSLEKELKK